MLIHFHDAQIKYTGEQLRPHFAYQTFGLQGDSIVAFIGPCEVTPEHLVDLEDVRQGKFIYSESMVHFIIEHFDNDLTRAIAFQRLFIDLIRHEICDTNNELSLIRNGDDLYDDIFKLTVSIATSSTVSCLIHTGVNISAKNTPVPTKGLSDYGINPQAFAMGVMNRYRAEIEGMRRARCKVRGV